MTVEEPEPLPAEEASGRLQSERLPFDAPQATRRRLIGPPPERRDPFDGVGSLGSPTQILSSTGVRGAPMSVPHGTETEPQDGSTANVAFVR